MSDNSNDNKNALDSLFWREEILQVMYWMEGEGLADYVPVNRLLVLLNTTSDNLMHHLKRNIDAGLLRFNNDQLNDTSSIRLTPEGKKEAGKIFSTAFDGMQKAGHGECGPDCEFCYEDGVKTENCVHNCADSHHHH